MIILLPIAILVGCIANTKLENNIPLDSGEIMEPSSTDQPEVNQRNLLFSVDTTFGQISQIEPSNGSTLPISSISMDHQVSSMTFNEYGTAYIYDHLSRKIGILNPCTGELNLLPVANEDFVICGISFTPDGLLYGLDSKNDQLVTYDLETGEGSTVGALNMNIRACGLAYDSTSERLIGATASTGEVFYIDSETGSTSDHIQTEIPFEGVGVEYASRTDSLLVSTGKSLYSVNLTDGSFTFLGEMEGHIDDLVFHAACQ